MEFPHQPSIPNISQLSAVGAILLVVMASCSGVEPGIHTTISSSSESPTTTPIPETTMQESPQDSDAALIDAAWANDVAKATSLVEAGADVNFKDSTQQSAYLVATSEGYLELLNLTLDHGADVSSLDSYNGTGLIRSAERGHGRVVGRLIQAGIEVNHVNRLGWTALHESIILGDGSERYVDTVRILVAGGADVELPSQSDNTAPLQHAESRNQSIVAQTLKATLAGEAAVDADASVLAAAAAGDADQLVLAIRAGGSIEAGDDAGRTPLLIAAANDHLEIARVLSALGADPDALDDRHDTPWLISGETGSVAMAEVLLGGFPSPDLAAVNRFGGTSLIPAAERGHVDYVRRVVATDIDVNHVNDLGWTALLEAVILGDGSQRYVDIVTILVEGGADSSIPDRDGVTAEQHARNRGHDDIAAVLASG